MVTVMLTAVVILTSSLSEIVSKIGVDSDRAARFLGVDLVETIGKRSIFGLTTTTNR